MVEEEKKEVTHLIINEFMAPPLLSPCLMESPNKEANFADLVTLMKRDQY